VLGARTTAKGSQFGMAPGGRLTRWRLLIAMCVGTALVIFPATIAFAAAPANDDFNNATAITSVPFNVHIDTTAATTAADDPSSCSPANNSVWYTFTPAVNETVTADSFGGTATGFVSAYTGVRGALTKVACGYVSGFSVSTAWVATAGVTYHVMVASAPGGGADVALNVKVSLPPANDNFDQALAITALPFAASVDTTGATSAADDPTSCSPANNSVWYTFTPTVTEAVTDNGSGGFVSVYTGSRGGLAQVACGDVSGFELSVSWIATAGVTYHIMVASSGTGGSVTPVKLSLAPQAAFTYPVNGQTNVDTTQPFTWSTSLQAQGYYLAVGTRRNGTDLVNSGVLAPTTSSYNVPALPVGPTLYAELLTKTNGAWTTFQAITFTAAPGEATFTNPLDTQMGADPTRPFTWATIPQAQGYYLAVGTTHFGTNVVNSGILPPSQFSYPASALPVGPTLYATVLTKVNGGWTRYQAIIFTAGPAMATFTKPLAGQSDVTTPAVFTWRTVAGAQNYILAVGTTRFGTDLVNSHVLAPTVSSYNVPALPSGRTLYATILTQLNGTWVYQDITFSAS
jgi:hypothetical protein